MTDIESLAASLVREYLSRKGLKTTLQALDSEMPRAPDSISNRAQLAKEMYIEKLMKKNKEHRPEPLRTMIEVMVKFMRDRGASSSTSQLSNYNVAQNATSPPGQSARDRRRQASAKYIDERKDLTNERQDYDELLKCLERSSSSEFFNEDTVVAQHKPNTRELKKLLSQKHLRPDAKSVNSNEQKDQETGEESTKALLNSSVNNVNSNVIVSKKILEKPFNDQTTKTTDGIARTKTKKHRTLNGPVISSGLTSRRVRGGRVQRGDKGLGHSLTLNDGGLLDNESKEEDTPKGETSPRLGPVGSQERSSKSSHSVKKSESRESIEKKNESITDTQAERSPISSPKKVAKSKAEDLLFEDIDDDLDQELAQLSLGSARRIAADFESKPISLETAMALKNLVFGTATSSFNAEWRNQSFTFCDSYNLEYGIVQQKGGPCGELAAVQCFVLKHLLFVRENDTTVGKECLQPSSKERTNALISALAEILWRAGSHKSAVIVSPTGNSSFVGAGRYKPDHLTETLVLNTFKSLQSLTTFMSQNIRQFESQSSSGCILFLYSVILSRGIKRVKSDMDEPSSTLMGAHDYCTQEMVNLIVTGKAVSNVFDGVMELDSGGTTKSVLKGIGKQGDVGLLSLFEHYGSCKVGTHLKTPKYPIWVICSESHFSVLFSTDKNLLKDRRHEKRFDLYYYDGLARQDEEIRLTVDMTRECPEYKDEDLVPPLELCVRTRWKKCFIDWNGTEPIL